MSQGNSDYYFYIQSDAWLRKRQQVLDRAGNWCERCGTQPSDDVHHLSYKRLGNEPLDDLLAVCRECHDLIHGVSDNDPKLAISEADEIKLSDSLTIVAAKVGSDLWFDVQKLVSEALGLDLRKQMKDMERYGDYGKSLKQIAVRHNGKVKRRWHLKHDRLLSYLIRVHAKETSTVIRGKIMQVQEWAHDVLYNASRQYNGMEARLPVDQPAEPGVLATAMYHIQQSQRCLVPVIQEMQSDIRDIKQQAIDGMTMSVENREMIIETNRVAESNSFRITALEYSRDPENEFVAFAWMRRVGIAASGKLEVLLGQEARRVWDKHFQEQMPSVDRKELPKPVKSTINGVERNVMPEWMWEKAAENLGIDYDITEQVNAASTRQIPSMPLKRISSS